MIPALIIGGFAVWATTAVVLIIRFFQVIEHRNGADW